MKKLKSTLAIFSLPLIFVLAFSCCESIFSGTDCGSGGPFFFTIVDYQVSMLERVKRPNSVFYDEHQIEMDNTIDSDKLFFRIGAETESVENIQFQPNEFFFIPALWACTPQENPVDSIASIFVFSNEDYLDTLRAGTILNPILEVEAEDFHSGLLSELEDGPRPATHSMRLKLKVPPAEFSNHTFSFEFTLTDGQVFAFESEEVGIYP